MPTSTTLFFLAKGTRTTYLNWKKFYEPIKNIITYVTIVHKTDCEWWIKSMNPYKSNKYQITVCYIEYL